MAALDAQVTGPKPPAPAPPAQPPAAAAFPELAPETVVASHNGRKLTFGELKNIVGMLPAQMQQNAARDRKGFVQQYFLIQHLASLAEKEKLDQQSPTRETLAFNRAYVLMNAQLSHTMQKMGVSPEEQQRFYEANKDRYAQVKVKVIYVSFTSAPPPADAKGAKSLTEAEAKAKIEKILAEARGGADFVKLVKAHSEDQTSAEKDGDFGTIRRTDNLPEPIRAAIFALKQGQISEPIRQPNGFYLFRAEQVGYRPYSEVRNDIYNELQQARFKQWMDGVNRSIATDLKIENDAFFSAAPPATAQK